DPVITSTPSTATVNRQTTPNGASGPRLRQPSSAAPAMTKASATETPYSQAAGCAVVDQGARLARKVPAGTAAANTPATRHRPVRAWTVAASEPRSPRVTCAPTVCGGTVPPSQPSTVGVRSVSTTRPGCRVETALSRPEE